MYRSLPPAPTRGGPPSDIGGDDGVVTLDQIPRWSDTDHWSLYGAGEPSSPFSYFSDPLASPTGADAGPVSRFPVDREINSKVCLWRGDPWNLEVDAVVNSTNELLDEANSSPGLHEAAGPGLTEEWDILLSDFVCSYWMKQIVALVCMRRLGRGSPRNALRWVDVGQEWRK